MNAGTSFYLGLRRFRISQRGHQLGNRRVGPIVTAHGTYDVVFALCICNAFHIGISIITHFDNVFDGCCEQHFFKTFYCGVVPLFAQQMFLVFYLMCD